MVKPQALYDINKSFTENWQSGPQFSDTIPASIRSPESKWQDWLGFKIASRIGVAPCPLMLGKGIALASKLGFDIFTYKSIRGHAHPGNPLPNLMYVNCPKQLQQNDLTQSLLQAAHPPEAAEQIAVSNSFGNGSLAPEQTEADIALAKQSLQAGQVLIVSIYGEANEQRSQPQEYAYVASLAKQAGADIIEANLSCPNIHAGHGLIYEDPEYLAEIVTAILKAVPGIPVLLKLGFFADPKKMQQVLIAAARAGAAGICGINSVSMRIVNEQNEPAFGSARSVSGVSGYPIRQLALQFITRAADINHSQQLGLSIVGIGGVTQASHFADIHAAGADVALTATGFMWNPYLGLDYQRSNQRG